MAQNVESGSKYWPILILSGLFSQYAGRPHLQASSLIANCLNSRAKVIFLSNKMRNQDHSDSETAYEKYLHCCGGICGCICCSFLMIKTSNIGMMERFGKFTNTCQPGLNYYNPCTEKIQQISLQTRVIDMAKQSVYTKDNMSVYIDTALFYRVIDPFKSTYIVKDVLASIMQLTYVTLRTVCGEYIMQDLLGKRLEVNEKIEHFVREESQQWGIYVDHLLLKDLSLSNYLQANLSKVPTTKRLVESKIISAKADLESAKLYREAADILDMKAAMQIRFLETLELMNAMKSKKTVIMPLHPTYDS